MFLWQEDKEICILPDPSSYVTETEAYRGEWSLLHNPSQYYVNGIFMGRNLLLFLHNFKQFNILIS